MRFWRRTPRNENNVHEELEEVYKEALKDERQRLKAEKQEKKREEIKARARRDVRGGRRGVVSRAVGVPQTKEYVSVETRKEYKKFVAKGGIIGVGARVVKATMRAGLKGAKNVGDVGVQAGREYVESQRQPKQKGKKKRSLSLVGGPPKQKRGEPPRFRLT